ncbi:MAG: nicotinate-nicotinamide nucleotide adenylyltransferase [Bilophila wadsworthia]
MTPAQTIGILGGTFNPVHIGHLRLATAVAEALRLKHVDLMPCAVPPHKADSGLLSFEMRVSLLQGALETPPNAAPSDARLQVSTLEGELPHPSYTWNLITEWRKRHTSESPMFILGGEDFMHADTWHRGLELPNITNFVVVPRCQADEETFRATIGRHWPKAVITEPDENNLLRRRSRTKHPASIFRCRIWTSVPRCSAPNGFWRKHPLPDPTRSSTF